MGGDTESSESSDTATESVSSHRKRVQKFDVYEEISKKLRASENEEVSQPGFEDELWNHFNRFSVSYATDVNVEQPEDVIMHMKLLNLAEESNTRPAFEVRIVQAKESNGQGGGDCELHSFRHFYEITISTVDKPQLLSKLTSLLSEIGLNIQEAHAFSTADGYSLDTFVVDGWSSKETEQLREVLEREIPKIQNLSQSKNQFESPSLLSRIEDNNTGNERIASRLKIEQTAKALQEAQVLVQLLEKEHALAVQEDLAIANEATSSL
ncbi:hypothetical protein RHMOL_Rhmol06G0020500 [Rhododendron molle]|uniref:Uncharacterized protein n=1 Tax=Rhododendron molle TaxID=49168 RepID=A0ACC0N9A3_RHOML|nr:hypothetical protein RHMOL_Rhmol06G0020500 [Rhododendron molle]